MSGKQQSTGLLPPQTVSEPTVPVRFSLTMNGRGLLLSPMSRGTASPHSSTGVTGIRATPGQRDHGQGEVTVWAGVIWKTPTIDKLSLLFTPAPQPFTS